MTEQEGFWKRSGASLGVAGNFGSPMKKPGYRSDAQRSHQPKPHRKRTEDQKARKNPNPNFVLEFDDNYAANDDDNDAAHEKNEGYGDHFDDHDAFFGQEQRKRNLTKVPQLSVEERRKRISQLKQRSIKVTSTSKRREAGDNQFQTPQIARRANLY